MEVIIDKDSDRREDKRDKELLIKAQNGDEEAFGELWLHYKARLYASTFRRVKKTLKLHASGQMLENAEDIVNEAFMLTWKTIKKIPPHVKFRMWLWGVLRNVIRGKLLLRDKPYPFDPSTLEDIPEDRESHESHIDLKEYTLRLDPKYQDALGCHYLNKMTKEEYRKKTGGNRELARYRANRAIEILRDEFKANELEFGDF